MPIPPYLNEKKNIVALVVFTAIFAVGFINIYSPFEVSTWQNKTDLTLFTFSTFIALVGMLIVVISRILMYYFYRNKSLILWKYLIWIFGELSCMALFYSLFLKLALKDERLFTEILEMNLKNVSLILLLPYAISWLYFAWQDKKEQVERMAETKMATGGNSLDMIAFYDEKQELRFSVKKESMLYLESAENYVSICYLNKGKISKYLLRNTLKKMEDLFSGSEIIRCHRSYMVNFMKVKVIRKDKDGLVLELDSPTALDIPVSKTYVDSVMKTFTKFYSAGDHMSSE
jgi:hypothetical protein